MGFKEISGDRMTCFDQVIGQINQHFESVTHRADDDVATLNPDDGTLTP